VTDAVLGAAGLGDIGEWFPDTAAEFAGADSAKLLERVVAEIEGRGWRVVNADGIVFAEAPKLSEYKPQIEARMARLLRVNGEAVNIKAKTGERVGPIGRQEAISAEVIVLIQRTSSMRRAVRRTLRQERPRRSATARLRRRPPIVPQAPIPQGHDGAGQGTSLPGRTI
jgi:2-C-methyl-D-erythritol 2,4-cyclodiphosphate synthase